MNRFPLDEGSLTLKTILTEHRRVEDLKRLAAITRKNKEPLPTRKTDLAKLIVDHLEGDGLRLVWEELDELQRAAVAEVVHSVLAVPAVRVFRHARAHRCRVHPPAGAREDYSSLWGTDELPFFSRYDGLMFVTINALGAYCLDIAAEYVSAPLEAKPVLRVLPNLEIAALDAELDPGDRLALDTYAVRQSERVWRLEPAKLLETAEAGRSAAEIRNFLVARSTEPLPDTVTQLIEDVGKRCARARDCGPALLVECADAALAVLIANDTRTRKHCMRAGECHLVVPEASEAAFRRALREVGYLLATGGATLTKPPESDRARRRRRAA